MEAEDSKYSCKNGEVIHIVRKGGGVSMKRRGKHWFSLVLETMIFTQQVFHVSSRLFLFLLTSFDNKYYYYFESNFSLLLLISIAFFKKTM